MRTNQIFLTIAISVILMMSGVVAWEGPYNYWGQGEKAGNSSNQNKSLYNLFVNPDRIGSLEASGSKQLGCATAVFGGLTTKVAPMEGLMTPQKKADILKAYAKLVDPKAGTAGNFDKNLAILIELLKKDKKNKYTITIKRIKSILDKSVTKLPKVQSKTEGNVKIDLYRPYNFNVKDIEEAMESGYELGLGVVYYKLEASGKKFKMNATGGLIPLFAHMVQGIAMNTKPDTHGRYPVSVYDPYYPAPSDNLMMVDGTGKLRMYFWNKWAYVEELIYIEKTPIVIDPPKNNTKTIKDLIFVPVKDVGSIFLPPVPFCGDKFVTYPEECDDGNKLNSDTCTNDCRLTRCGDGILQTPNGYKQLEQCDDGNIESGDGCSSTCKIEYCGDGIVQKGLGETCEKPGSVCDRVDTEDGATYPLICTNDCKCPLYIGTLNPLD